MGHDRLRPPPQEHGVQGAHALGGWPPGRAGRLEPLRSEAVMAEGLRAEASWPALPTRASNHVAGSLNSREGLLIVGLYVGDLPIAASKL